MIKHFPPLAFDGSNLGFKLQVLALRNVYAKPETIQIVLSAIAKQLSIDDATLTPETKFTDLGADSLDIVEIMMTLEEKFDISVGEGGVENISTIQDAADLIEKVMSAST
ncbi:hypothetical protein RJT34_15888 [Clitoria ternatea]|uniref:Acyl carrier protein n=1 Tax=Clitoria ternatea TaxID=43366 RepID=A0AAN9PBV1_CLITE